MADATVADEPHLLNDIIEGLSQAAGAASQMIHAHQNPKWMILREGIQLAKEGCIGLATFQASKISVRKH